MTARPAVAIEGIVTGRQDLGESDRIFRILSPTAGKLGVFARGARGPRSRWAVLDVGVRANLEVRPGRSGGLATLAAAEVVEARVHLRRGFETLALAVYACEIVGGLAREHHAEPTMYGFLETTLLLLDAMDGPPASGFRLGLESKALTYAGLAPIFTRCVVCGEAVEPRMELLVSGVRHVHCATEDQGISLPVSGAWAAAAEQARRTPLRELVDHEAPAGPLGGLAAVLEAHLGRPLGARALLDAEIGGGS
jgi:DNA repair protein RecO (recombination protein O)